MALGAFDSGGAENVAVTTVSGDYLTDDEDLILVDATETVTITLASADTQSGNSITVKDKGGTAGSDPITVATEGSETIDGDSTTVLGSAREGQTFVSGGADWSVEHARHARVEMRVTDPVGPAIGDVWFRTDL